MVLPWLDLGQSCRVAVISFVPMNWDTTHHALSSHLQLGVKALTYNDLIQAQKEISAHNQQLREQSEQLEKDNSELRSQSLRLVCAWGPATAGCTRVRLREDLIVHSLGQRCVVVLDLLDSAKISPGTLSLLSWSCTVSHWSLLHCLFVSGC